MDTIDSLQNYEQITFVDDVANGHRELAHHPGAFGQNWYFHFHGFKD
jgi:hypothetical protein